MAAMMRSLSSCLDATRMWRRTERANLEKKPSTRFSQEPCLGVKVNSKRPGRAGEPCIRLFGDVGGMIVDDQAARGVRRIVLLSQKVARFEFKNQLFEKI